jgi:hypothetical protein
MWFGGVDIPPELVATARSGRLVVFVGAGASIDPPSSLTSFIDLVEDIGRRAGRPPKAHDRHQPDVFLGELDDAGIDVHGLVAKAIDIEGSVPNALHRAVIAVAQAHPPIRIVTTNYDRHLATAAHEAGLKPEIFRAPALPAGDDFEGLVHIHGALGQAHRHLIVTDKDFGHAYLREAWAARFLERMYSKYALLFIGYSHTDVVLRYLARSLGREHARYVLIENKELSQWRRLGIEPIPYDVIDGSHAAVTNTLQRWAGLASLGSIGHRARISEIVAAGTPTVPEDISYIEDSLGDPQRVQYVVDSARGTEWLTWIADRPEFASLFVGQRVGDEATMAIAAEVTDALARWVADQYVAVEVASPAALRTMRQKRWTPRTWSTIAHRLFAQGERDARVPDWQMPWLVLALAQTPPGRTELLDVLLAKKSWRERVDVALLVLEHRTRPVASSGLDFCEVDATPHFDVGLVGDEYWLTEAWKSVFKPSLDGHVTAILHLIEAQIRAVYRLLWSLNPTSESISFGRSAIEVHPQDDLRDPIDMLIDAIRDCLEHLLATDPGAGAAKIDEWAKADEAILRRTAVHGWRVRTDKRPDEKVAWVCDSGLLYDLDAQHEIFTLLKDSVPSAGEEQVQALLRQVDAGPPAANGETESPYRRYNLLVWLAEVAPDSELIADACAAAQAEYPDYRPRERPDLNMYMVTSGPEDELEPFSPDQLHAMIQGGPADALAKIRLHNREVDPFGDRAPTWTGTRAVVRACVTKHPGDGLALAAAITRTPEAESDSDLYVTLIDAWGDAELADDDVSSIVDAIGSWPVETVRRPAARMLAFGGGGGHPTAWHQHEKARALAASLWPDQEVPGSYFSIDNLTMSALNDPGGNLIEFWTKVVRHEWTINRDSWQGIPVDLVAHLDKALRAEGQNGLLARATLGGYLPFYFSVDPDWTRTRVLPMFDSDSDTLDARAVWQTFLTRGRPNDGLLEAGLLPHYLQTCRRFDELGGDRSDFRLAAHLSTIVLFTSANQDTWLPEFILEAPEPVRVAWAHLVGARLRDLSPDESERQWTRWLHDYWSARTESLPAPLTDEEATATAEWVFGLPCRREEAVSLVEQTRARLDGHGQLLHSIEEADLNVDPKCWARFLTHLLRQSNTTNTPRWAIDHHLPGIVRALRATDSDLDLDDLINQAMRLGCADAPDW